MAGLPEGPPGSRREPQGGDGKRWQCQLPTPGIASNDQPLEDGHWFYQELPGQPHSSVGLHLRTDSDGRVCGLPLLLMLHKWTEPEDRSRMSEDDHELSFQHPLSPNLPPPSGRPDKEGVPSSKEADSRGDDHDGKEAKSTRQAGGICSGCFGRAPHSACKEKEIIGRQWILTSDLSLP